MRVVESGRVVFPAGAAAERHFQRCLLTLHGRGERLRAIAGVPRATRTLRERELPEAVRIAMAASGDPSSEWLLLRDYDGNGRERSVVFLFRNRSPFAVVKVRATESEGSSLATEAEALRAIAAMLDGAMRATVPRVEQFATTGGHEVLVTSALRGCSLSILMQRSLRPRSGHVRHLLAAARWLGTFHRMTRSAVHGDFWPRNILFTSPDEVSGVVDWEHASARGASQWDDVFLLPLLYVTDAPLWRATDRIEEFRRAFASGGRLAPSVDAYLRTYASAAAVDRDAIPTELASYLRERHPALFDVFSGVS